MSAEQCACAERATAMFSMSNGEKIVFFKHTPDGLTAARLFRSAHREFSRRRIRAVLQCCEVIIGKVYRIGDPTP